MLSEINGLDICRIIRQKSVDVLILILSARSSETDRIVGLEVGADDYLVKTLWDAGTSGSIAMLRILQWILMTLSN